MAHFVLIKTTHATPNSSEYSRPPWDIYEAHSPEHALILFQEEMPGQLPVDHQASWITNDDGSRTLITAEGITFHLYDVTPPEGMHVRERTVDS